MSMLSVVPREFFDGVRACSRMQAWAGAQLAAGVAELASRPDAFGADMDIALALREPVGAVQRRV